MRHTVWSASVKCFSHQIWRAFIISATAFITQVLFEFANSIDVLLVAEVNLSCRFTFHYKSCFCRTPRLSLLVNRKVYTNNKADLGVVFGYGRYAPACLAKPE
jgi:hypothetical protein